MFACETPLLARLPSSGSLSSVGRSKKVKDRFGKTCEVCLRARQCRGSRGACAHTHTLADAAKWMHVNAVRVDKGLAFGPEDMKKCKSKNSCLALLTR